MLDDLYDAIGVKDISIENQMLFQMIGNSLIVINNMKGVLKLSQELIIIKASKHQKLVIEGEFLEILSMNKNDISVSGRIRGVCFDEGNL